MSATSAVRQQATLILGRRADVDRADFSSVGLGGEAVLVPYADALRPLPTAATATQVAELAFSSATRARSSSRLNNLT